MTLLPVIREQDGALTIPEAATGEAVTLREASPRALLEAQDRASELRAEVMAGSRALAVELAERFGHGVKHEAGFEFKLEVTRSWQKRGTVDALRKLLADGLISQGEFDSAVPAVRVPSAVKCKGLVERLMLSGELEAAKALAETCSVSAPRVSSIAEEAVAGDVV